MCLLLDSMTAAGTNYLLRRQPYTVTHLQTAISEKPDYLTCEAFQTEDACKTKTQLQVLVQSLGFLFRYQPKIMFMTNFIED